MSQLEELQIKAKKSGKKVDIFHIINTCHELPKLIISIIRIRVFCPRYVDEVATI